MDLSKIKGVGEVVTKELSSLGIQTIAQLLDNYPRRYEDYSAVAPINKLKIGKVSLQAKISNITSRYARRGMHITEAIASDGTGSVKLVWFNQPFRKGSIKVGQEYYVSGTYDLKRSQFTITSPSIELVSDISVNTARILPIYRETKNLKSTKLRKIYAEVFRIIDERQIHDWLPSEIRERAGLISRYEALRLIHLPEKTDDVLLAKKRFTFEELFVAMFASQLNKKELKLYKAPNMIYEDKHTNLLQSLRDVLQFDLTDDQRRVSWQVLQDMQQSEPMNRIIEGDVGSGKTMVALFASLFALNHNMQVAVMSPTEILARQHYATFQSYLSKINQGPVHLLVGSQKEREKTEIREHYNSGKPGIAIGTHALISKKMKFNKLALVVVDEQHRFGVDQRKALQSDNSMSPHFLSMTATPIPRSLALTIFGELDISVLQQKPIGRKPIKSELVQWDDRAKIAAALKDQIQQGRQAFIVCPSIESSNRTNMRAVSEVADIYKKLIGDAKIATLHGRISAVDREVIMEDFAQKRIDVLVSTTVIEVGIDFPNASIMVIESAERFGLAQIHQLRGRVGRGDYQGYCYLIPTDKDANIYRLEQVSHTIDGFKLAEFDLSLRGPGAVYGSLQHGALDFRLVDITDVKTIEKVNKFAKEYIDTLDLSAHPQFAEKVKQFQIYTTLN